MKNIIKNTAVVILITMLNSCSTDTKTPFEENALKKELKLNHKGVLEIDATTYVFKNSGRTVKFKNGSREFDFELMNKLNYKVSTGNLKSGNAEYLISNPKTDEHIRLYNLESSLKGTLKFDVELSNGQNFYSVLLKSSEVNEFQNQKCPVCIPIGYALIEAIVEMNSDNLDSNCKEAINACSEAGGKPGVELEEENGWFSSSKSCSVTCN